MPFTGSNRQTTHTSVWVSPDSRRMLVGAAVAAAVSLLGYSGFSNSRLQILQTQQRTAACKQACTHIHSYRYDDPSIPVSILKTNSSNLGLYPFAYVAKKLTHY